MSSNSTDRSVAEEISNLETSLEEKRKEAITPWASDSPLVPWLISSVLFNLAAGVHYLTTNSISLDKIAKTLERNTIQAHHPSHSEHQSLPEKFERLPLLEAQEPSESFGMALHLGQKVSTEGSSGVGVGQEQKRREQEYEEGTNKPHKELTDNVIHMKQFEAESRPIVMHLPNNKVGQVSAEFSEPWEWPASSSSANTEFDWSGRL